MSQYALDPDYGQSISKTINMFTFSRLFSENDSFKINNVHILTQKKGLIESVHSLL